MRPSAVALSYSSSAKTVRTTVPGASIEVREQDHRDERPREALSPDEPQSLRQLLEEAAALLGLARRLRARHEDGHERGREQEARGVDPEGRRRTERRDEHASERCSHERGALLNSCADATRALHGHSGRPDDVREERRPCRRAGCVEERTHEHERHQLPELDSRPSHAGVGSPRRRQSWRGPQRRWSIGSRAGRRPRRRRTPRARSAGS